jgi:hypothetical protein
MTVATRSRSRREHTYEIDAASPMLGSEQWIPLDGIHEAPLALPGCRQRRRKQA